MELKINKSQVIREAHAKNPTLGSTELSALLEKEHKGYEFKPAIVSTVLTQAKKKAENPNGEAGAGPGQKTFVDGFVMLRKAKEILGQEEAIRLLKVM